MKYLSHRLYIAYNEVTNYNMGWRKCSRGIQFYWSCSELRKPKARNWFGELFLDEKAAEEWKIFQDCYLLSLYHCCEIACYEIANELRTKIRTHTRAPNVVGHTTCVCHALDQNCAELRVSPFSPKVRRATFFLSLWRPLSLDNFHTCTIVELPSTKAASKMRQTSNLPTFSVR